MRLIFVKKHLTKFKFEVMLKDLLWLKGAVMNEND